MKVVADGTSTLFWKDVSHGEVSAAAPRLPDKGRQAIQITEWCTRAPPKYVYPRLPWVGPMPCNALSSSTVMLGVRP